MMPKIFDEFIKDGTVRKQVPDNSRAKFLIREAEHDYEMIWEIMKKIKLDNKSANIFIKLCYDVIMEIIRAKLFLGGYNVTGKFAHESEISYMRVLGFEEKDVQFINKLRYFRNGMLYYGTMMDKTYAEKVLSFTKKVYPKLKELTK